MQKKIATGKIYLGGSFNREIDHERVEREKKYWLRIQPLPKYIFHSIMILLIRKRRIQKLVAKEA